MADETIWGVELVPEGWFAPETQADGWFDRDLLDATPQVDQPPIRIYGDDGGDRIKRSFYDRQIKEFEDQLEALAEAPKDERAQAVQDAVEAFQPIQRVDYGPALNASARAILSGLRSLAEARMQRTERDRVIAEIEADLALIKRKKRRNNEAALLLLM